MTDKDLTAPEAVEMLAKRMDVYRIAIKGEIHNPADNLRALAAERDALTAENDALRIDRDLLREQRNNWREKCKQRAGSAARAEAAEAERDAAIEAVGRLRGRDVQKRDAMDVGEAYDLAIDEAQDAIRAALRDMEGGGNVS